MISRASTPTRSVIARRAAGAPARPHRRPAASRRSTPTRTAARARDLPPPAAAAAPGRRAAARSPARGPPHRGLDEGARLAHNLRQRPPVRRHHRHADLHGLESRHPETFLQGGQDEDRRLPVQPLAVGVADIAQMAHAPREPRVVAKRLQDRRRLFDDAARQEQGRDVHSCGHEALVGAEEGGQVLPRLNRAHEQHRAELRGLGPGWPRRGARRADDHPLRADTEAILHGSGGVLGDDDDEVGGPGMTPGQAWVVAANLGTCVLGMVQEVQIVHGDDLRGATGRHQQRVRGVRDVHGAGQALDRGPPQPVPEEVQQADGQPPVPRRGVRHDPGLEPVAPGAGEQHERAVGCQQCAERRGQLVHILADAGALPERRPIVEQDAHVRAAS
jgi:hypothetical protein